MVGRILHVSFRAPSSPIGIGVRPRFLSNFDTYTGMARRAAIFNSEVGSLVPAWGYARDTKGWLDAILKMTPEELELHL